MHETEKGLFLSCFSARLDLLWASVGPSLKHDLETGAVLTEEGPLDLSRVRLGEIRRGSSTPPSSVLYAPRARPDTTVMVTCSVDGWYTLAYSLACSTQGLHVMIRSVYDGLELHHLNVWSDQKEIRSVLVNQDPKWTFFEKGPQLEFEDVERYRRRLKRERLDRPLLLRYLAVLGWDVADPCFWEAENKARYVELRYPGR